MPQKKERETNCRDDSRPCRAWNLELEIRTEDSTEKQQRRKRSDPKGDLLEAGWFDRHDVSFEAGFFRLIANRISDAFCEQRLAIDPFGCFLCIEAEDRPLGMNDAVADFYFLIFVHERLGDVGIVTVLDR